MKEYDLFGYKVVIDVCATKEWYNKVGEWDCECGDCRHFVSLARKRELPTAVLEILKEFGIVPEKATYVCEILTEAEEILYQFSYHMAGNILKESDGVAKDFDWGEARCCREVYPYGVPEFPMPYFDLDFLVRLPRG